MPTWPSRLLHSNPSSSAGTPSASSRHAQYFDDSEDDDDSEDGQDYPSMPAPHHFDPAGSYSIPHSLPAARAAPPRGHARSMSDKLPSLFGGQRNRTNYQPELEPRAVPHTQDPHLRVNASPPQIRTSPKRGSEPDQHGNCATCDGRVRWPGGESEFRCPTCQMVNDLKPRTQKVALAQPRPSHGGTHPGSPAHANVGECLRVHDHFDGSMTIAAPLLTVDQTRTMIDRCITTFVARMQATATNRPLVGVTPPDSPDLQQAVARDPLVPSAYGHSNYIHYSSTPPDESGGAATMQRLGGTSKPSPGQSRPAPRLGPSGTQKEGKSISIPRKPVASTIETLPSRPNRKPPPPPLAELPSSSLTQSNNAHPERPSHRTLLAPSIHHPRDQSADPAPKAIFKPVEEYLVRCLNSTDCLNKSFTRSRPRPERATKSEDDVKSIRVAAGLPFNADAAMSELDAKTLLLGDVAENGQWWIGERDRINPINGRAEHAKPHSNRSVNHKSPGIHWRDVYQWYSLIVLAGQNWREKLGAPDAANRFDAARAERIDAAFSEGRTHLVRTLLKCFETLLKRPGRPVKHPEDLRFLLVLLANPLLYPSSVATPLILAGSSRSAERSDLSAASAARSKQINSAWESGHALGIIKRILGLLCNTPQDCQRLLTSWFARYDEEHFRRLVELVQGFVTHRLKKQHGRKRSNGRNPADGLDLIPNLSGSAADTSAQLHAAIGLSGQAKTPSDARQDQAAYVEDWQVRAAARVMALLFAANKAFRGERSAKTVASEAGLGRPISVSRDHIKNHGQLLSTTDFYNSLVDLQDIVKDFDLWESSPSRFTFCQYPFFLSVGAKIRVMDHDAKRQMDVKAREAFFDSILRNKQVEQFLLLKVRRECLVEDSLKSISEVVGQGQEEIKKGLKIQFVKEEGIDAGGLRKEWFLLLLREIFDPRNGMFAYDEESPFCYFNPNTFEASDQFFLVGALLGLAIYNSVILDVALPPFIFKRLLSSGGPNARPSPYTAGAMKYTLENLAEVRPGLARGLRQLLEYSGDVETTFCRDFTVEVERYGVIEQVPLCAGGAQKLVTNSTRGEFVEAYIKYLLDTQVTRQYEPFRRGFFTVCGGNALSLFQPEEIELLLRGSDEPLDVPSLKAVASYDNWHNYRPSSRVAADPAEEIPLLLWFWEIFGGAPVRDQRKLLSFITGSDRIPAVGATSLIIRVSYGGPSAERYPIARTCFNQILLYDYQTRDDLRQKLWTAVNESEGFGLK